MVSVLSFSSVETRRLSVSGCGPTWLRLVLLSTEWLLAGLVVARKTFHVNLWLTLPLPIEYSDSAGMATGGATIVPRVCSTC